jgi:hypothetical protein
MASNLIRVENDTLARDSVTGAIIETDITKLHKYRARKALMQSKDELIEDLSNRINKLEELIGRMANG